MLAVFAGLSCRSVGVILVRAVLAVVAIGIIVLVAGWQSDADACADAADSLTVRQLETDCSEEDVALEAVTAMARGGSGARALPLARAMVRDQPDSYRSWLALAAAARGSNEGEYRRALRRVRELNPRYRAPQ